MTRKGKNKTLADYSREFRKRIENGETQREIAASFRTLTNADVSRIIRGIEPGDDAKRKELGLHRLDLAPVCPVCDIVHVGKCKRRKSPRVFKPIRDEHLDVLRYRLENREVIQERSQ